MLKGVIFDFNGTLFWDSDFHDNAWLSFAKKYNIKLTYNDIDKNIHGRSNKTILNYLFNKNLSIEELNKYIKYKESIYRKNCLKNKNKLHLAEGVKEFLNFLKQNKISMNIATASDKSNLDFYIEIFDLKKWFNTDLIVYDDGMIPSKPDPKMFKIAVNKINLFCRECMVIEDSLSGLEAAKKAGFGYICAVFNDRTKLTLKDTNNYDKTIASFDEIDRKLFI